MPKKLPEKLKEVRVKLNLSLEKMVGILDLELERLGYADVKLYSGYITEFEQGKREPSLPILLAYARVSGVNVEFLIDDGIKLSI